MIDKTMLVPVFVMELKAVSLPAQLKVVARKDLEKLRDLDFQVFDDAPVNPVIVAVAFQRNAADKAMLCRLDNDGRKIVFEEVTPIQGEDELSTLPRSDEDQVHPADLLPTVAADLIFEPSHVLFRDDRFRTVTYQSNEACWQMRAGSRCVSGREGWIARYEVDLNPGRADLEFLSTTDASSKTIVEFKVHGERLRKPEGQDGLWRSVSRSVRDAYIKALVAQGHENAEPRGTDGSVILEGLHHWEKKVRACRAEYRRCVELVRNGRIAGALLLFEDYVMVHDGGHGRLGLPNFETTKARGCEDLMQAYPKFRDALARLSEHYQSRSEFFIRAVSDGLEPKGIKIHYFGTLRLP